LGEGVEKEEKRSLNVSIGELIGSFFTSPGPGGVVVVFVIVLATAVYYLLTRWILEGGEDENERRYFKK
jgi:hypothetical protein